MIEQVARALCLADGENPNHCNGPGFGLAWNAWAHKAHAAIEAMREPTPEMLQKLDGWIAGGQCAETAWKETLSVALKETP